MSDPLLVRINSFHDLDYKLIVQAMRVLYNRLTRVEKMVGTAEKAARAASNHLLGIRHDRKHYWTKTKWKRKLAAIGKEGR